ncbi:MAG: inositol-3-phosphate synthase [Thermoprotei archaeon]|nr:MAG: inositol-3-phosphate synthase [Thermoprotei archaeon]
MGSIKVAIIGVGNAAAALVQGVYLYKEAEEDEFIPGVYAVKLGPYHIGDIEFVAAFDVSRKKIGKDLSEAIFAEPNIVPKFVDVPKLGVIVHRGPIMDGVAPHMKSSFEPYEGPEPELGEVADILKESRAEVVVNLLPVGSEEATRFYALATLKAGAAFVNAIPVFIASDPRGEWPRRYEEAGLPLLGDDVKGQIGATILHRTLVRLLHMRGVLVEETYQLNIGGNTDFLNMTVEERLHSKRISKTRAVTSILPYGEVLEKEGRVRIGPSDYVPFLGNIKVAYIYIKGRSFANFPVTIDVKLTVDDKSMIAGILVDAIRAAKIAMDKGMRGAVKEASAFLFKHPPVQAPDDETARKWFESFITG